MKPFLERLKDPHPLIYDGGFGSELFLRGVELSNSTLANELYPDVVSGIHTSYIEAGADAIGTNTFVASPLHLEMASKEASDAKKIARTAVQNAKAAVEESGRDVYIAGSIGPSPGAIEADTGDTEFGIANTRVRDAHERVASGLVEGGIDFFCIETQFSAKEAALIVDVVRKYALPVAVNLTCKYTKDRQTGKIIYRTDWGHSPADLLDILASGECSNGDNLLDDVHILGLNCGAETDREEHTGMPYAINGLRQFRESLAEKGIPPKPLMAYPNAGMPRLDRKTHRTSYAQAPDDMAPHIPDLIAEGAHLMGGCCGTTPSHIRAFREILDTRINSR